MGRVQSRVSVAMPSHVTHRYPASGPVQARGDFSAMNGRTPPRDRNRTQSHGVVVLQENIGPVHSSTIGPPSPTNNSTSTRCADSVPISDAISRVIAITLAADLLSRAELGLHLRSQAVKVQGSAKALLMYSSAAASRPHSTCAPSFRSRCQPSLRETRM